MIMLKPNYQDKAKLCYMGTESFIIHIKTEDFYEALLMMLKNVLTYQTTMRMIKEHF